MSMTDPITGETVEIHERAVYLPTHMGIRGDDTEEQSIFHPWQWIVFAVFAVLVATAMVWVPALVGRP